MIPLVLTLKNDRFTASVTSVGAELLSLKNRDGLEYMWQKDPKYWGKTSPVLFPIVGNLRNDKVTFHGTEYGMAKHGLCRAAEFTVESHSDTDAVFSLCSSEETLAHYPYQFKLTLAYHLSETGISITYTVENIDNQPIDFCFGAHPGFNVPLEGVGTFSDYRLEFNADEPDGCPVFDFENNQINMDKRVDFMKGSRTLPLDYSYFDEDALVFDKVHSDRVRLVSDKTERGVEVRFADFDFVAFWTPIKMDAPFLCIEPWCGMAVCSDEGDTFEEKRGVKHLETGASRSFVMEILPF
mgnify:CR=1 FL=1